MYAVIIPVKNEEQYIGNTLNALCQQTLKPTDIIIVDDNSNDDTRKIASSYESVTVIHSGLPDENHLVDDKIGAVVAVLIQLKTCGCVSNTLRTGFTTGTCAAAGAKAGVLAIKEQKNHRFYLLE